MLLLIGFLEKVIFFLLVCMFGIWKGKNNRGVRGGGGGRGGEKAKTVFGQPKEKCGESNCYNRSISLAAFIFAVVYTPIVSTLIIHIIAIIDSRRQRRKVNK